MSWMMAASSIWLTRMPGKSRPFVTSCDDTAFLKTDGEVYRMNGGVLSKI